MSTRRFRAHRWGALCKSGCLVFGVGYELPPRCFGHPSMWRPFVRSGDVCFYAGEAMRLPSSVTFSQRVRYGIGRGFGEGVNREVPGNVPQVFSDMFVFWRRLRRSYRAFRRFRGVGIPPVGLYENETTTRMRIETARNRTEAIRRRRQGRGRWS